ncbi:MAG: hypothetical protein COZ43_08475 [Sphingomonadales bacterium CG_4_10_14_3_um_filter_58_15]|nr:MAG: hypothetical protein COZ43_08475 [Sphingomonadales bacterium CG_4_10_14_3_um_filter_58_15]
MMEKLQRRGEMIAGQRLVRVKSEVKSVLMDELPADVRITETADGLQVEARRLKRRLLEHSGLRDIGFLMRGVR